MKLIKDKITLETKELAQSGMKLRRTYIIKMVRASQGSLSLVWQLPSLILMAELGTLTLSNFIINWSTNAFMLIAEQDAGKQVAVLKLPMLVSIPRILAGDTERKQYFPWIVLSWPISFLMFRHSSKLPRSYELPASRPDGMEPQASITGIF